MKISKAFYLLFAVMLVVGLVPLTTAAAPSAPIEQQLLDRFAAEGKVNFFVKMALEADLSAAYGMDWDARGEYVVNALKEVAAVTQGPVIDYARKHGLTYQSYFVNNSVEIMGGDLTAAQGLAALPGVAYIRGEHFLSIPDPLVGGAGINGFQTGEAAPEATTDWGITDTKADQFWTDFGLQGDGIKVANIDTGVQYNHPALDQAYGCPADPTSPVCWYDPSNTCGGTVCDNNGHGTHTMGTMVADDDQSLTWIAGMAPNATWIACKGCESNSCSDSSLIACAQWLLQPGGSTANRPDVVNNSWGGGGGDTWYQTYVQSWVAAGNFPAFSAGNSSGCSSLGSPGDYQESFATTGHDSARNHYYAQGPSTFGHTPYTKPNISGPAVSICSTVPTNGWSCGYSGTSMASPHTAGAVALLWSCSPSLVGQIDATFQILQNYADPPTPASPGCGVPPDNEGTYEDGYGYLNVLAAGANVCGGVEFGTLQGYVYDQGGNPLEGATVSAVPGIQGGQIQATTDPTGFYTMQLVPGTYNATASKTGYSSQTVPGVVITANQATNQNFTLTYIGTWTQLPAGTGCPDWTRFDGEYYAGTGYVYLMGGRTGTSTDGTIYRLDPATNTCTGTGLTMPTPISNYTINLVNNGSADLLCTFGGRNASGTQTLAVQCLNPVANTVSQVTTLPAAYTGYTPGAQVVVDNMVYVFGGFNNAATPYELSRTDRFNPVTNTFTQIGNLSLARSYLNAAVVDGKIYAFGGTVFDGTSLYAQTRAEVMADPGGAGTWNDAAVTDLPTASAEGRAYGFDTNSIYTLAGKIVIAGGGQWPAETAEALTYDVATDTYDTSFPDLNILRRDQAGFFIPGVLQSSPGKMWVLGGRSSAAGYGGDSPPYAPPETFDVLLAGPTVHVYQWSLVSRVGRVPLRLLLAQGRVHDQNHNLVAGITVTGIWTLPDSSTVPATSIAPSDSFGMWRIRIYSPQCGLYKFDIAGLSGTGYTYNPAANEVGTHKEVTVPCK